MAFIVLKMSEKKEARINGVEKLKRKNERCGNEEDFRLIHNKTFDRICAAPYEL